MFKRKIQNSEYGFTIMEVLAVIFIISVALVGSIGVVLQNVRLQERSKNSLIALGLAQEGMELTKNKRDNNFLQGRFWYEGFLDNSACVNCMASTSFVIHLDNSGSSSTIEIDNTVSQLQDARFYLDSDGFYTHVNTSTSTNFFRLIKADYFITASSTIVSSTVDVVVGWLERGRMHDYELITVLYDWY